ncbi:MAG: serine hydrolase [Chitinophagales bacterium]|nr:serine hydrolase [Chitinophagales bacterium]
MLYLRPDHHDDRKFPKSTLSSSEEIFSFPYATNQLNPEKLIVSYKNGEQTNLLQLLDNSLSNAFLIVKDGTILLEKFYNKYDNEKTHGSFSVSKGMLASMLGIALDKKWIKNLEEPITTFIPELLKNDSAFAKITIKNLLEMNSGIRIKGADANPFGDLAKVYYGNNFFRFLKSLKIEKEPGLEHRYNQTDPELLSLILTRASGMSLSQFFEKFVWTKIGANIAYWNTYRKEKLEKGYCCFNARVHDYAKFAQLYLQKGRWNEEQLIPEAWVNYTTVQEKKDNPKWKFDFHNYWYPATDGAGDFTAQGYNRQMLYINPNKNLILFASGSEKKTI